MGAQKVSRKRLAEHTGISRPSLANKLDGKVPFTYDEFGRVVAALDLDWSLLLAETPAQSTRIPKSEPAAPPDEIGSRRSRWNFKQIELKPRPDMPPY